MCRLNLSHKKTGEVLAQLKFKLLCQYGSSEIHITDYGSEFNNSISDVFYWLMGTMYKATSAYHLQWNGLIENVCKTTQQIIWKNMYDNQDNWFELLDSVHLAMRVSKHKSTGYTPFRLLYGHEPILSFQMEENIKRGNPVPPTLWAIFNNVTADGDMLDFITMLDNSIYHPKTEAVQQHSSNLAPEAVVRWIENLKSIQEAYSTESNRRKWKISNISGKILQSS